ncbi:MAG: glycosyltransferase family 2 protein [Anaeroplasmataceae bacterium]
MTKIRVMVPTYNEEENVIPMANAIREEFKNNLSEYEYQILFIDNKSKDSTREKIRELCKEDKQIKAIFNAKNFGQFNSPYYGMIENEECACTITLCADFQQPVDMIHKFVREWEKGYKVVVGVKTKSKENKLVRLFRSIYYRLSKKWSRVQFIEQYDGFGLYDISFTRMLKQIKDPMPFIRGIVVEYADDIKVINYTQEKRRKGKSSNNFGSLYDAAMLSFTTYTKTLPRLAGKLGMFLSFITGLGSIALVVLGIVLKISFNYAIYCGIAFLISLNMFFIGMVGEYVMSINQRSLERPLVIEEERINFDE